MIKAPYPWFGGKSRVASLVWQRFGQVDNYVEPFFGSGAVLLGRPDKDPGTETVNDIDCYLANFWRAIQADPDLVSEWADWPVNEADLHARHLWLVNRDEFRERMKTDPDFYDVKIAGWWVWGICQWIGSGWCSRPDWTGRTNAGRTGKGVHAKRPSVAADNSGRGVHRKLANLGDSGRGVQEETGNAGMGINRQLPHLGDGGRGDQPVTAALKRPHLSGRGTGVGVHADQAHGPMPSLRGDSGASRTGIHASAASPLEEWFFALANRMRRVRVCCGDWKRVLGPSVTIKHGISGIFLDPPYDMRVVSNKQSSRDGAAPTDKLYNEHDNDLSAAVREWAIENGKNPLLRIALCGYEGEHAMPGEWECVPWKAHGGYSIGKNENAARERIWFSPACLRIRSLFDGEATA